MASGYTKPLAPRDIVPVVFSCIESLLSSVQCAPKKCSTFDRTAKIHNRIKGVHDEIAFFLRFKTTSVIRILQIRRIFTEI